MNKGRLEAFSDGVLAIIITIMVLGMDTPEDVTLKALLPQVPVFVSYVLSYIYVGIYWINHHHIMQVTRRINGTVGKPAFAFLAVADTVNNKLDWQESLVTRACGILWRSIIDVRHRFPHI